MYLQEPYAITSSSQRIRRRQSSRGYMIVGLSILCALLIIGTFITLFVIYFIRYRNTLSNLLSYPTFVCTGRPCGCPKSNNIESFISKIVGGQDASPYIYPWLVTLTDRNRIDPFCAGFIISSNVILTAAHCLNDRDSNQVQILSKIHDLRDFNGDRHDIDQWIIHPEYRVDDSMHLNDIALVKIQKSFAKDLQPSCLPKNQSKIYPPAKTEAVVSGWGKVLVTPNSRNSPILQHVVMPIVDPKNIKCRQSITDTYRQICAGYDNLSIDACSGDSGAPLLVVEHEDNQGYFVAAGIVSYGNRQCDASISSGVYTRVSFYLDWIYETLTYL
jgi:secreted trypsin-like serine protease